MPFVGGAPAGLHQQQYGPSDGWPPRQQPHVGGSSFAQHQAVPGPVATFMPTAVTQQQQHQQRPEQLSAGGLSSQHHAADLIPTAVLPTALRRLFPYEHFNAVQSACFQPAVSSGLALSARRH